MCTVTFIPSSSNFIFTSNRDEKAGRSAAISPEAYPFDSGKILFPKDADAGGTWIAAHQNGNVIVFLNGAFTAHTPKPPYRKSRGLILVDLIDSSSPVNSFMAVNLNKIEPFTSIIWDDAHLFECRWDGKNKHSEMLESDQPRIWSSVTLYDESIIAKRKSWFDEWIGKDATPTQEKILHFHQFTGDGDKQNDLMMNRGGTVSTISITSISISETKAEMLHLDVRQEKTIKASLTLEKSIAGNDE
jgi:hypothetical protein